jgi:hypothetical protein
MAAVGDIYQIRLNCLMEQGVNAENVFYYRVASIGTGLDAEEVADLFNAFIVLTLDPHTPSTRVYQAISAINGMDNDDFWVQQINNTGGSGQTPLPHPCMVSFRSPWNGPGTRRGRHYLPIGTVGALSPTGGMTSAAVTAFEETLFVFGIPMEDSRGSLIPVTLSGGFKLGETPVESNLLLGLWEFNARFGTIDSRRPEPLWAPTEIPPP